MQSMQLPQGPGSDKLSSLFIFHNDAATGKHLPLNMFHTHATLCLPPVSMTFQLPPLSA